MAKARLEIEEKPVMLGKSVIVDKQEEKYLSDILNSEGQAESALSTV